MTTETELSGTELDLVVANALKAFPAGQAPQFYNPSTDWSIGGPLIEREMVCVGPLRGQWIAIAVSGTDITNAVSHPCYGATLLEAAMRAIVKKYGAAK